MFMTTLCTSWKNRKQLKNPRAGKYFFGIFNNIGKCSRKEGEKNHDTYPAFVLNLKKKPKKKTL